jgi:hypothetical protein
MTLAMLGTVPVKPWRPLRRSDVGRDGRACAALFGAAQAFLSAAEAGFISARLCGTAERRALPGCGESSSVSEQNLLVWGVKLRACLSPRLRRFL